MNSALEGQVVLVFGATGRVGPGVCRVLAEQGATVAVHYHSSVGRAEQITEELTASGGKAFSVQADVTEAQSVRTCFEAVVNRCGRVDALVNQVHKDKEFTPRNVADMEWEHWSPHIEAMKSHFLICKGAIPHMRRQKYGRIVYVSGGLSFRFFEGCSPFSAAKAGMNAFCKTLAKEEGRHGITVNVVAPGKILDPGAREPGVWQELEKQQLAANPIGRFATPEDIGNGVLTFLLPGSSYLTGQTLFLAGGEIMPMP